MEQRFDLQTDVEVGREDDTKAVTEPLEQKCGTCIVSMSAITKIAQMLTADRNRKMPVYVPVLCRVLNDYCATYVGELSCGEYDSDIFVI